MVTQTRASKQLGDFGEGLVTYTLVRKDFEIAYVDHIGADLIAEKGGKRYAISVKIRLFREGSKESRMVVVEDTHQKVGEFFKAIWNNTCICRSNLHCWQQNNPLVHDADFQDSQYFTKSEKWL